MKLKKSAKIFLAFAFVVFIALFVYFGFKLVSNKNDNNLENNKYSSKAQLVLKKNEELNFINDRNYSKTVEVMLEKDLYIIDYKEDYYLIEYKAINDFSERINTFLSKNYTAIEINKIFSNLNETNINALLKLAYTDLNNYYQISNLDVTKIERYESYRNLNNLEYKDAVTRVNLNLDIDFYSTIETVSDPDSYSVFLNKYNALPANYEPSDLVSLSYNSNYKMRKLAAEKFEELISAAKLDGVNIVPYSAYRSYNTQSSLYNTYKNRDGQVAADTYSARPGHSEHQTGLAVDVRNVLYTSTITDSDYAWLKANSYKYGFIVRYPKDSISITGYIEEPWHLRYIGETIAKDIYELNITLDEYYDLYLK